MNATFGPNLLNNFVGTLRACGVLVGLGLVMLSSHYCPTGHTDCAMISMDVDTQDAVCVLACGLLFQSGIHAAPGFFGQVSVFPDPLVVSFEGIFAKPDVPPPKSLA